VRYWTAADNTQYVTEDAWAGRVSPQDSKSKLLYPRQDEPGEKALKYFREAIKTLLIEDDNPRAR
jgi:hypothetical protein